MITMTFADMTDIVNSLPNAELAFKSYIRDDRYVPHKQICIVYTPRININQMMRKYKRIDKCVSTLYELKFEAHPLSYNEFAWKLLTPVNVEG